MKVLRAGSELRRALHSARRGGDSIGFVPTMGALHAGHLSLVRAARRSTDVVVMSIFVNPLQFGPQEDYESYPRQEARDLEVASAEGVDVVFIPSVDEMYPHGDSTRVSVADLSVMFEGTARPGHFDGVCTIVAKLFNIVEPDVAFFGQKDAQQVAVIRRMVRDLHIPVEVSVGDTVREPDGLALSSRNAYLSSEERRKATVLFRSLLRGRAVLEGGGTPEDAESEIRQVLSSCDGVQVDYACAVEPDTFGPPRSEGPVLLAVAARVGTTRLIDNLVVEGEGA